MNGNENLGSGFSSFPVTEKNPRIFDHNFCFTLLYPVASFFEDLWTIFVAILVYSSAAGRDAVVQVSSYVQVRHKMAGNCMIGEKGVKKFNFPT